MTRPRSTTSQSDELGAILASLRARMQAVELLAHTPCTGGGGCPCPENVLKAGDTMTGFLTLNANPTSPLHAATKQYVDTADNLRVLKSGDTMTGQLTMQSNIALTANSTRITQNSTATWSGDAGAGFGKLEYHSNRWYINAGSDSTEVARFRRGAGDVGHIANDGRLNFPFWTTTGRNYSNEWIEFPNFTGIYSPNNAAHFYPNNLTYGSWRCDGSRGNWFGIEFATTGGNKTLMMGGGTGSGGENFTGVHLNGVGWRWYFNQQGLSAGAGVPIAGNNTGFWGGVPGFGIPAWNLMGSYQFFNPSDGRFKDNQRPLPLGLSFINRLKPTEYTNIYPRWVDEDSADPSNTEKILEWEVGHRLRAGLIAQEVKQALIDEGAGDYAMWALGDKDDPESFQALSYHEFIAPLVKAVQELSQRLETLENK